MSLQSPNRIAVLKARLAAYLNGICIEASADETMTSLIDKMKQVSMYLSKSADIMPVKANTTFPALFDEEHNMFSDRGAIGVWNGDGTVTISSDIPEEEHSKAWPHATCAFSHRVKVSGLRLLVDASHNAEFNMGIWYQGDDDATPQIVWLSKVAELATVDFSADRTVRKLNFGAYLTANGHTNPPIVSNKYDLLKVATGLSKNYVYTGSETGQLSFGQNAADESGQLMQTTIDLNVTPYLYYSISQDAASGCTFALYTNDTVQTVEGQPSCWYMLRDGSDTTAPSIVKGGDNYQGSSQWVFGQQTGCIDLRQYVSSANLSAFKVNELKLYGYSAGDTAGSTVCTFNYLFFGSAPITTVIAGWGQPATPDNPIFQHAAVGGEVTITKVDYYAVGKYGDWTMMKKAAFANE